MIEAFFSITESNSLLYFVQNSPYAIMCLGLNRSSMTVFPGGVTDLLMCVHGQHTCGGANCWPFVQIGQTSFRIWSNWFHRVHRRSSNKRSPRRDPVGAGAPWFVLGSAGKLGRPQMPWRRDKNNMVGLEKLGKEKER
jgi:hypothetical protein